MLPIASLECKPSNVTNYPWAPGEPSQPRKTGPKGKSKGCKNKTKYEDKKREAKRQVGKMFDRTSVYAHRPKYTMRPIIVKYMNILSRFLSVAR